MAGSQKTMLAPPQREGVQAAATAPILVPQRVCRPTQCLHSPSPAPPPKSSKKPKTLATEDMFPHNWSPPPVEFLASRAPRVGRGTAAHRQVGTVRPQGLRRLVCRVPMDLEQKPQCSDPKGSQDPQEELFWDMAASSRQAASPVTGAHSTFSSGDSEPYVNSLDYLLREKRDQALEQAWEKRLVQDGPDLDFSALNEKDVPLAPEHRRLVERFSMSLQVMPSVHPGEAVFLSRHHPLPCVLDCSQLKPRNCLEGLFLSSPLAQQLCLLRSGLLSNLYLDKLTCPVPLLQWLFQLLTWPPETSSGAFGLLWDISVKGLSRQSDGGVHIWSPSLREVMEVFHSLGARNPALHPLEPSPHSRRMPKSEARPSQGEQQGPPLETALDISLSYIYKFLTLCALAPPGAQADGNLSDLIALLCRAGLDAGLRLLPKTDLQQLLLRLLENIREWPGKLQQLCLALSSVSDHHHNLLALVQLFLDVTSRSRQLRSQLSLVVIARMLDQEETLLLWQGKAQLSALSQLLSFMRPSSLGQYLSSETLPPCQGQQPKGSAELDHKVCYLCHSLLTLAGVVVSCQDMTADQRGELQLLCVQLDRHVSRHIRESPQAMHWTKLKDLAVQTYIRWQELLSRYQPQVQCFSP